MRYIENPIKIALVVILFGTVSLESMMRSPRQKVPKNNSFTIATGKECVFTHHSLASLPFQKEDADSDGDPYDLDDATFKERYPRLAAYIDFRSNQRQLGRDILAGMPFLSVAEEEAARKEQMLKEAAAQKLGQDLRYLVQDRQGIMDDEADAFSDLLEQAELERFLIADEEASRTDDALMQVDDAFYVFLRLFEEEVLFPVQRQDYEIYLYQLRECIERHEKFCFAQIAHEYAKFRKKTDQCCQERNIADPSKQSREEPKESQISEDEALLQQDSEGVRVNLCGPVRRRK